eukprot:7886264-Lingulodinium_polyedra.AAC.1
MERLTLSERIFVGDEDWTKRTDCHIASGRCSARVRCRVNDCRPGAAISGLAARCQREPSNVDRGP